VPIALDAAIASLAGMIGALAPSIGAGEAAVAPMLLDEAADIVGVGVVVVVSAGVVLLQPLSASAAAATARPSGHVIRSVM
jgi:hypothetical protein